jgi:NADH-quinone oxidoreductase subunit E/NADP-reducing hydrogenase subunit HndA
MEFKKLPAVKKDADHSSGRRRSMNPRDSELLSEFSVEQITKLNALIDRYKTKPGALIPLLEEAQVLLEYLPVSIQRKISDGLNLPLSRVYGVVTFYSFFTMKLRGRHTIRVCMGTACYVRGAENVVKEIQKKLHIKEGETTEDRAFTLETVRCLGTCGLAPVMVVDKTVHGRVALEKIAEIIDSYKEKFEA